MIITIIMNYSLSIKYQRSSFYAKLCNAV